MGFKGHWMVFSKTRIKNSEEKPAALRNAKKAACGSCGFCASSLIRKIREFAMQPFEPSDGYLVLRKLMANGLNDFDMCPYFWSH
jgi:hypothetical protein